MNNTVFSIKFGPTGLMYIGGDFTDATGTAGDYVCGWSDSAFHSFTDSGATELNGIVMAIDVTPGGYVIIGGSFTNAGGDANANYVAAWRGNNWGALEAGGLSNYVRRVSCFDNGDIYLAGGFTSAGSLTLSDRIVRSVQGAYLSIDINLPGSAAVYAFLEASDGSLYIGGEFSTITETPDELAESGVVGNRAAGINLTSASANVYPFMQIHGPGALRSIVNYTTDSNVQFNGLTLQAGEHINLYFDPTNLKFISTWGGGIGEIKGGRGNLMRYVVAGSDYANFHLKPGANYVSLFMTDTTAASGAFMMWKPMFWGLDGALL